MICVCLGWGHAVVFFVLCSLEVVISLPPGCVFCFVYSGRTAFTPSSSGRKTHTKPRGAVYLRGTTQHTNTPNSSGRKTHIRMCVVVVWKWISKWLCCLFCVFWREWLHSRQVVFFVLCFLDEEFSLLSSHSGTQAHATTGRGRPRNEKTKNKKHYRGAALCSTLLTENKKQKTLPRRA